MKCWFDWKKGIKVNAGLVMANCSLAMASVMYQIILDITSTADKNQVTGRWYWFFMYLKSAMISIHGICFVVMCSTRMKMIKLTWRVEEHKAMKMLRIWPMHIGNSILVILGFVFFVIAYSKVESHSKWISLVVNTVPVV